MAYEIRGHIAMDMVKEKKVFDSFVSTLSMCESAPDEQDVTISLTLGELRQHVQWCQYAAIASDTADRVNHEYQMMNVRLVLADRLVKEWQEQEKRLNEINGALANLKDRITTFHKERADQQRRLREHAET